MIRLGKRIPVVAALSIVALCAVAKSASAGVNIWTTHGPGAVSSLALDPAETQTIYAAGAVGIFKSSDAGQSWVRLDPENETLTELTCVAVDPSDHSTVYAANTAGQFFRSDDAGAHWTPIVLPGILTSIAVDSATSSIYVGTKARRNGDDLFEFSAPPVYQTTDRGVTWKGIGSRRNTYALLADSVHRAVFAGTDFAYTHYPDYVGYFSNGGGILNSLDGGSSWQLSHTNLGSSVTALALSVDASAVYAGTNAAGLYESADGGVTWTSLGNAPTPISALAADPASASDLYVAGDGGVFIFHRTSSGGSWEPFSAGLLDRRTSSLVIDKDGRSLHVATPSGVFDIEIEPAPPGPCDPGPDHLCLLGSRFRADLAAINPHTGTAVSALAISPHSNFGYFSLPSLTGDASLPEVLVKMADATSLPRGGYWAFFGSLTNVPYSLIITDTSTGRFRKYEGEDFCGGADTASFPATPTPSGMGVASNAGGLAAEGEELSLLSRRFRVTLSAIDPHTGLSIPGVAIPQGSGFGYFSLPSLTGDPNFPEVFVKMLDATSLPGENFWFFHTGLTSLHYLLTVTDTKTGAIKTFENDPSDSTHLCGGADTQAFSDAPAADLTGTWNGTEKERGLTEDYFCPGYLQGITLQVAQNGDDVTLSLPSGGACSRGGTADFQGKLVGNQLSGTLRKAVAGSSCVLTGVAVGTGEPSHIHLEASIRGPCNSVGLHIDLTR